MNNPASQQANINNPLHLSQLSQEQEQIEVRQLQNPPGEGNYYSPAEHTLFISLAPRPVSYLQIQDDRTYTGMYKKGDILITPANTPLFVRWQDEENCLQINLNSQLIGSIAQDTLNRDPDRIELLPAFGIRDSQLEAIAMMLFKEFQDNFHNRLYIDSLTNVLAVNLLRRYTVNKPLVPVYDGGLPPRQLSKILDYIDTYLDRNIKLADLAKLLDMSPFHFSRMFKRSLSITPHQYLSQQRVERAKQLLRKTDLLITDIALECGFNSHSHLTKKFRQFTGVTPKNYRAEL